MTDIQMLYVASKVKRWHGHDGPNQNLAEHSFGVAMIIAAWHPKPSAELLKASLQHDLHEKWFADIPYGVKQHHPELKALEDKSRVAFMDAAQVPHLKLTEEEGLWLKFADQYEALLYLANATFVLTPELQEIMQQCATVANTLLDDLVQRGVFPNARPTVH